RLAPRERGRRCVPGKTEGLVHPRRKRDRPVADGDDAVRRRRGHRIDNAAERRALVVKSNRDRLVPPGVLELIAAVAGEYETNAERAGSLAERSNLITRCGSDDEDPLHTSRMSSGDGSAQQYQFSESTGTARCGDRGR